MQQFNISINDFLNIQRNARASCGDVQNIDVEGKTYCLASVSDLTQRLLYGVGIRRERGKKIADKRNVEGLSFNIGFMKDNVEFSGGDLVNAKIQTKKYVCNPWAKGVFKKTRKDIRDYSNKRYGQCIKGINVIDSQLDIHREN